MILVYLFVHLQPRIIMASVEDALWWPITCKIFSWRQISQFLKKNLFNFLSVTIPDMTTGLVKNETHCVYSLLFCVLFGHEYFKFCQSSWQPIIRMSWVTFCSWIRDESCSHTGVHLSQALTVIFFWLHLHLQYLAEELIQSDLVLSVKLISSYRHRYCRAGSKILSC